MTATGFVQMLHLKTDKIDEMKALHEEWRDRIGSATTVIKTTVVEDRDNPGWHLVWVEFPSYSAAMKNSDNPITEDFGNRISVLCEEGPSYCNLNVIYTDQIG